MAQEKMKIYCETSFWSWLVSRPSTNPDYAVKQAWTRKWWEEIYAIRREIPEECGHSVHRLIEMMREKLKADEANGIKHEYAQLPIARVAPAMA